VAAPHVFSASSAGLLYGYVSVSALLAEGHSTSTPALLVWGEQDAPSSSKAKAHERIFISHQMVVLPDAPHPCYLKYPKEFNAMLVEFAGGPSARPLLEAAGLPALKVHARSSLGASQDIQQEL